LAREEEMQKHEDWLKLKEELEMEFARRSVGLSVDAFTTGIDNRISALQRQMDFELIQAGDNEGKKEKIREKFERRIAQQKKRAWAANQLAAFAETAMLTAQSIMKVAADPLIPTLAVPFWQAAFAAMGAVQGGIIIAQKPPNFGKGGPIDGPMHAQGGVHINAEGGEFMLQRSAVAQLGLPYLKALNEGKVGTDGGNATDYDKFVKALENQTNNYLNWDERGFTSYMRKRNAIVQRKAIRYSVNG